MIGSPRNTVQLVPHHGSWARVFAKEKKRIKKALGDSVVDIQHIGSTSIPQIHAKPIIDIIIGVHTIEKAGLLTKPLKHLGYEYMRDRGNPRVRLFFAKGPHTRHTHHLHIVKYNGKVWRAHTSFARYLRTHKHWAKKYEVLKKKLAQKFEHDRDSYTSGKAPFIQQVMRKARGA